jgi:glycosyltransferase involved in cell wall biosynthesis
MEANGLSKILAPPAHGDGLKAAPLVSIVTPSYNQGPYIRATIESVLSQSYSNIEYIVMDGGSTDETASVVKDYSSRLKWVSAKDRGQSHAINKGFQISKGEILSWINSDDVILPGAVSKVVRAFNDYPDAGAIYGEGYCLDKQGGVTGRFPYTEAFNLWKLAHLSDYILQQTVYFRKSVLDEVGLLDEDLHYVMDWDILIRIGLKKQLQYIPEYLGSIREYPETKSLSGGTDRIREIKRVLRKYTGLRYPPGYLVYGLDTYGKLWSSWIEKNATGVPGFVSAPLAKAVWIGCRFWIDKLISKSDGWYSDGWASNTVRVMFPPTDSQRIVIEGHVPEGVFRGRARQRLSIHMNNVLVSAAELREGSFTHVVEIPEILRGQTIQLRLCAARYFRPSENGGLPDRRKLSFKLKSVMLEQPRTSLLNGGPDSAIKDQAHCGI